MAGSFVGGELLGGAFGVGSVLGGEVFLVGSLLVGGLLAGSFFFWEGSCWVMRFFWWCDLLVVRVWVVRVFGWCAFFGREFVGG